VYNELSFMMIDVLADDANTSPMGYGLEAVAVGPDVVLSCREMLMQEDFQFFVDAEKVEFDIMTSNWVFELMYLPAGAKAISSKFTYKQKRCSTGKIKKYKARLVARGFEQRACIDYINTSAPVAGVVGFQLLVCITLTMGLKTH
jgi:hypothetical protein